MDIIVDIKHHMEDRFKRRGEELDLEGDESLLNRRRYRSGCPLVARHVVRVWRYVLPGTSISRILSRHASLSHHELG